MQGNIKRMGILVETDEGEQYMMYCENPNLLMIVDAQFESIRSFSGTDVRSVQTECTVTVENFMPYTVRRGHRFDSPTLPELDSTSTDSIE